MIVTLAGGVGAARFLTGLVRVVEPTECTAIVNVGDDVELHGLWVSPDLDTITYTLAGAIDPERGWGLAGETWNVTVPLDRLTRANGRLTIETNRTFVPAERGEGADRRRLGLRVFDVRVVSQH